MGMVPTLRFPEFEGDWLEKRVEEIAPLQRGFDLPVQDIVPGIVPIVYSNGILKTHNEFKAKAPGVITGRSGTIGNVTYVEEDYWPHNTSLWVTDFKGNDTKFIYYFYYRFKLERFGTGSGVPTLNRNDVHVAKRHIPKKEEQTKIAEFLGAVDEKIRLLEARHEQLTLYKKAMMQKIFSQTLRFNDKRVSEIPNWKSEKISSFAEIKTGSKDTQNRVDGGKYPFFVRSNTVERINSIGRNCEAVLTSGDGVGVGKNYHYINGPFDYHQRVYAIFDFRSDIVGKYFFYYFKENFYERVIRMSAKNSVDSVRMNMIADMVIPIPPKDEQKKISEFLSAIDDKIDAVNAQITQMRKFKKGLLQQMFV